MSTETERAGVIVVRVWTDDVDPAGLRARITGSSDLSACEQTIAVASSVEEILAAVRAWVEAFASRDR